MNTPHRSPAVDGAIIAIMHSTVDCVAPMIVDTYLTLLDAVSAKDGTLQQHNDRIPKVIAETLQRIAKAISADPTLPEAPEAVMVAGLALVIFQNSRLDGITRTGDNVPSEN